MKFQCPSETGKMREILLDYPAGRLESGTRVALEQHLAGCSACREAVETQTAVWDALDAWDAAPVSLDFNRRLWQKIDEKSAQPWYTRLASAGRGYRSFVDWKPMLPAAILALVVVGAGLFFERPHDLAIQSVAGNDGVSISEVDQAVSTLDDLQLLQQLDSVTLPDGDAATRI
jgi:anti-sigma factor RsiW